MHMFSYEVGQQYITLHVLIKIMTFIEHIAEHVD